MTVQREITAEAEKGAGLTLADLQGFVASCYEQGVTGDYEVAVRTGFRGQLRRITATATDQVELDPLDPRLGG